MNVEIKSMPFSWNDNFSEEALEVALKDFQEFQDDLIGMALAKLDILEKQGCKVVEEEVEREE